MRSIYCLLAMIMAAYPASGIAAPPISISTWKHSRIVEKYLASIGNDIINAGTTDRNKSPLQQLLYKDQRKLDEQNKSEISDLKHNVIVAYVAYTCNIRSNSWYKQVIFNQLYYYHQYLFINPTMNTKTKDKKIENFFISILNFQHFKPSKTQCDQVKYGKTIAGEDKNLNMDFSF